MNVSDKYIFVILRSLFSNKQQWIYWDVFSQFAVLSSMLADCDYFYTINSDLAMHLYQPFLMLLFLNSSYDTLKIQVR